MHSLDLFPVAGLNSTEEDPSDLGTVVSIKPVMGDITQPRSHMIRIEKCYTRWDKLLKRGWRGDEEDARYWLDEVVEITLFEFWEME